MHDHVAMIRIPPAIATRKPDLAFNTLFDAPDQIYSPHDINNTHIP